MTADATLYLFDGNNLLHVGGSGDRRALADALASYVAVRGARGVLVWDGAGEDAEIGPLSIRYAPHADALLERLAAEHRDREKVVLVSSDFTVLGTAGQEVQKRGSREFANELQPPQHTEPTSTRLRDAVDEETRARLERLRRGEL